MKILPNIKCAHETLVYLQMYAYTVYKCFICTLNVGEKFQDWLELDLAALV